MNSSGGPNATAATICATTVSCVGRGRGRLASAFDMNPSIDKHEPVLTIAGFSADPDIGLVLASAGFYGLDDAGANQIVDESRAVVSSWKDRARVGGRSRGYRVQRVCFFPQPKTGVGADRPALPRRGGARPQRLSNSDVCPA